MVARHYLYIAPADTEPTHSETIKSTLNEFGYTPMEEDETAYRGRRHMIEDADLIIADISGSDPNVMFEVGCAMGMGKGLLPVVSRDEAKIPDDLARMPYSWSTTIGLNRIIFIVICTTGPLTI